MLLASKPRRRNCEKPESVHASEESSNNNKRRPRGQLRGYSLFLTPRCLIDVFVSLKAEEERKRAHERAEQRWQDCLKCLKESVPRLQSNPWLVVLEPNFIHDYLDSLTETLANLSKHEEDLEVVGSCHVVVAVRELCLTDVFPYRFEKFCRMSTRRLLTSVGLPSSNRLTTSQIHTQSSVSSGCSSRYVDCVCVCLCLCLCLCAVGGLVHVCCWFRMMISTMTAANTFPFPSHPTPRAARTLAVGWGPMVLPIVRTNHPASTFTMTLICWTPSILLYCVQTHHHLTAAPEPGGKSPTGPS
jgi:hypothetical protein